MRASLEVTFDALLEQLGPVSETPDGTSHAMKIEPWPGGRWFRDLGDGNGHCWATVQAIKRPTLLEFCGPLFMSQPVANNVQYRLERRGRRNRHQVLPLRLRPVQHEHHEGRNDWLELHSRECRANAPSERKPLAASPPENSPRRKIVMPVAEQVAINSIAQSIARRIRNASAHHAPLSRAPA